MASTILSDLEDQIQTKWSKIGMQELRESYILPSLVSKKYEGEIRQQNDTVRVSQVNSLSSDLKEVGVDADSFTTNKISTSYCDIVANRRAVSAVEFEDLIAIQSIIDPASNPDVRKAMMDDIGNQINDYLYSIMIPSTSSPDHTINSTAAMSNTVMANMREAVASAKWPKTQPWYHLMGVGYYSDFLADNNLIQLENGFDDQARVGGQLSQKRYNFENYEDDSVALATSSMAFLPEAVLYAAQTEPRWKLSDLHGNKKFGYVLSVDLVFGAKLSIGGASKCYKITSAA